MRVISGTAKGFHIKAPGRPTRPATDLVRGAIFSILENMTDNWDLVLDLFSGSGALGIEALSRGAKRVIFVEKGRQALRLIQTNLNQFGLADRSEILPKDANRAIGILKQRGEDFDLILMDPPYEKGLVQRTLLKLKTHPIYHGDSILVIEHNRREPLPRTLEGWNLIRQQKIGDTLLSFLTLQVRDQATEVRIDS